MEGLCCVRVGAGRGASEGGRGERGSFPEILMSVGCA